MFPGLLKRVKMKSQKLPTFQPLFASWESYRLGTASSFPSFSEIRVFQNHLHWVVLIRAQGYTLECHFQEIIACNFYFSFQTVPILLTSIPSLSINLTNLIWNPGMNKICTQRSWHAPALQPQLVYLPCPFISLQRPTAKWYFQPIWGTSCFFLLDLSFLLIFH